MTAAGGNFGGPDSPEFRTICALPKFGAGIGLHRMLWLCAELREEAWFQSLAAIKVTGSNGKGSVVAMTAAILRALGISCGVYTSPHLLRFHERIRIDDAYAEDAEIAAASRWLLRRIEGYADVSPGEDVGAFEAFTALALKVFSERRPETVVVEAGLGGRYDPTRIVPGTVVGLTSVDLEHADVLGKTHELIAYDKADLCPSGGTLVIGPLAEELARRLEGYCELREVRVVRAERRCPIEKVRPVDGRMVIDVTVRGRRIADLEVSLIGPHQAENVAVALTLVDAWLQAQRREIAHDALERAIRRGLASVVWPGRFELVHRAPDVVIDVGHSPDAMRRLVECVRWSGGGEVVLVTGVSYNKDRAGILSELLGVASEVIVTQAYHRGADAEEVAALARSIRPDLRIDCVRRIEDAMGEAIRRARRPGARVLVAGGLFLAIEAREVLRGKDPRSLSFF